MALYVRLMQVIEVLSGRTALHLLRFAVGQAYLWCDGDESTLIDAGAVGSAASIVQALTGIGRRPRTYDASC
uniref:Uncharacterized protein n=1 Tax=Streptomyces avermitilis TaxID=33903 RepID=A0A499VRU5_STRAX|nr:hypothetical protein SAVMC3_17660 [Streptomyces avermitilis]